MKKSIGIIISTHSEKTAIILVQRRFKHKKYNKIIIQKKRYMLHDPSNECNVGDIAIIEHTRPLSKRKRWQLVELLKEIPTH